MLCSRYDLRKGVVNNIMAIVTDSIVDVGNYTTFNIGLSKAISNYTADEIWNFPYCSSQWEYFKHIGHFDTKPLMDFAPGGTGEKNNKLFPLKYTGRNDMYYPQTYWFDPGEITYNTPDGIYCRVIWLYGTDEQISNLLTGKRRSIYSTDGFKVITQMDCTKVFIFLDDFRQEPFSNNANQNNINTLNYDNFKIKEDHDGTTSYTHPRGCSIFPAVMFYYNDKLYVHLLFQRNYESLDWSWGLSSNQNEDPIRAQGWEWDAQPTSFDGTEGCYFPVNIGRDFGGLRPQNVESFHTPTDIEDIGAMYQWYYYSQTGGRLNPVTEQAYLKLASWYGGMFYHNGKYYKPIIEDGYVTGYTDDMSVPSDIDNWIGNTNHDVPPAPPSPGPGPVNPWDVDPETYGWSGGDVSGMVKYYLLTSGQMSSLQTAIASNSNWTIDYLNCVVSCFVVPNSGIFFDAPIPTTVKFVLDNATQWDTGVACSRIQGTKNKSGGTIEIPRLTNTFYDFEPYSDYSVYIPFCGRIPIKGNICLGREIKVTYYPDVPTCSLTAVVSCGGATIAIAKGSFGTMTPVTSNGSDRKTAAVIGDVAPIITGIGTGIVGVALGNPLIVGAGASQALGGIMGGVKETVQSYAYSVGSSGDSSFFGAGNRCYYYANYPLIDEVVNNSMFGHSVGYLCNTVGKLSGFKGFTICANPHVTFSASFEEREEIERLLSMGVIL